MPDLNKYVKEWVSANCCDGEDRSDAHCDSHGLTSPELYELLDDLATDIIEIYEFKKIQQLEQEVKELQEQNHRKDVFIKGHVEKWEGVDFIDPSIRVLKRALNKESK